MIEIRNLTKQKVDEKFLERVAKKVLKGENRKEIDLSIALVSEARIKKLNKKYRGKNKVTDVLSFGDGLNEIIICPAVIKTKKELASVLIHGILHILGREHSKLMQNKEEYYAKALHY